MKRFESFGEYMYALLFAPLKKVQKGINQFYIFFKVMGKIFDEIKQAIITVRNELNVATASSPMLIVHGVDRGMSRYEGEDWEIFRSRLLAKGVVASQAGTAAGIVALIQSMGYKTVYLEPLYKTDTKRWAEAVVWISGGSVVIDNRDVIQAEINKIKPGTNLITLAHEQAFGGNVFIASDTEAYKIITIEQV